MAGRYVIYGAGGVGGVIGGRLALNGHDVALLARGPHREAIAERGLELRLPDEVHTLAIPVAEQPADLDLTSEDVVILAMKTNDTHAALEALVRAAPPDIGVVCAQNGVDNERMALRRFARVYAMCVFLPALHLEPGVVEGNGTPFSGVLDVGRYPGAVDQIAETLAADLSASGFRSEARADIMRFKYGKLRSNTLNSLDALCSLEDADDVIRRVIDEAEAVFRAAGIDAATRAEETERNAGFTTASIGGRPRGGGSSWQSLVRGTGQIETDYLNGEIVLLGRLHGVATPANEALQHLANAAVADGVAPRSVPMADVRALVAGLQ